MKSKTKKYINNEELHKEVKSEFSYDDLSPTRNKQQQGPEQVFQNSLETSRASIGTAIDVSRNFKEQDIEEESIIRFLVATDNHLGFLEKDPIRKDDSFVYIYTHIFKVLRSLLF